VRRITVRSKVCLALVAFALALPASAWAWTNPADSPELLESPLEELQYDSAHHCGPRSTPGIRRLESWIDAHYPGVSWGVYRCERLDKHTRSLHSEGRALDWHLDAGRKRERRAANNLIDLLLAPDVQGNAHALARRMGVQELIFNCRAWFGGEDGMGPYSVCQGRGRVDRTSAHRDHVHIGLNLAGAKAQTSFWRSSLAGS
jgi:hypothetical protein